MKEKLTPYLKELQADAAAIARQYIPGAEEAQLEQNVYDDPLMEDEHEVVPGLVHKYPNRALVKVSYQCAAHCRFCTRIRQIGSAAGTLTETDIDNIVVYLHNHPQIDDVILSGGDPLYTARLTMQLLVRLRNVANIKVMRIGTRLPLQSPGSFDTPLLQQLLALIDDIGRQKPFYILLHINHPAELTDDALRVIAMLRQHRVTLLSQTVFLKGVNVSFEVMYELFTCLYHAGVMPYYLYHCDAVKGIQHFAGSIDEETEIATRLAAALSGIACPTYVVDVQHGYGKIPVPLNFNGGRDFRGEFSPDHTEC